MKNSVLVGAVLLLGSLYAVSQASKPGEDSVCEVNQVKVKLGATKQFEQARKAHNNFHVAQKDKNPVHVWAIVSGPNTGNYMMSTCGLTWKGMDGHDDFDKKDGADVERTMGPFTENTHTSYYVLRSDLGGMASNSNTMPKMISVTTFYLKGDGATPFVAGVKKVYEAINKSNYPQKPTQWYQLANGGEGPQFVQVSDRMGWSDMQGPEKTLMDMLAEVYGKDDTTLQTLRGQVRYTVSELYEFRPDLSYIPAK